jgi:hypothetical protein
MNQHTLNPFYCRIIDRSFIPFLGKVLVSLLTGALFLIPKLIVDHERIDFVKDHLVKDQSFILLAVIVVAMLSLYYATYVLKGLMVRMQRFMKSENAGAFFAPYYKMLRDRNFVLVGLIFAIFNTALGLYLGIHEELWSASYWVLIWGYVLAGFICGMAVLGVYTVLQLMHHYAKDQSLNLDYRAPDNSGGLQFIGNAILRFGLVIIITGILIASYILFNPWSDGGIFRIIVKAFWVVFPFVVAMTITFSPIHDFSKLLIAFKNEKDRELSAEIKALESEMNTANAEDIQDKIDVLNEQRKLVFKMNTIPLDRASNFLLYAGNMASLIPGGMKIFEWLGKNGFSF